jgi:cysteine desulfurase
VPAPRSTYLDWNATTPTRPAVLDVMREALSRPANPSSVHRHGRAARQMIERARAAVASLVDAAPSDVIFTSGGTEANQLALRGFPGRRVIVSAVEHDSVRQAVSDISFAAVDGNGVVDLDALATALAVDPRPALVSLMLANNETGVIQPVAEAARLAHRYGALLHCDAVQGAGKVPVRLDQLGIDLLTVSAHKIGGPTGVGALVAPRLDLVPLLRGGGQESGRRAGTENVAGIVGFGIAAAEAMAGRDDWTRVAALRDDAENRLLAIAPEATIFGRDVARLPNTSTIAMPGVAAATQVMALDLAGVMVSAGAACSSGKVRRSHVLDAMGVPAAVADGAIRISLGWASEAADIDHLVAAWGALYARTRASAA